ncbi:MAG: hypothetical protein Q9218_006930 [Villophora microphyllina]
MTSPRETKTFLSLPPEIRNRIYGHLLTAVLKPASNNHEPAIVLDYESRQENKTRVCATILASCKQIAGEASAILYASNTFFFSDPVAMARWLDKIGPEYTKLVSSATIWADLYIMHMRELEKVFDRGTGLRRLRVTFSLTSTGLRYRVRYARRFLEIVQPWLANHTSKILRRTMSQHNYGFQHTVVEGRRNEHVYWNAVDVTFVASVEDGMPAIDGICFDLEEATQDVGSELPELMTLTEDSAGQLDVYP